MVEQKAQFRRVYPRQTPAVRFLIDGLRAHASAGDLLLTAMLLNQRHVRRFEFDASLRGGFCLMGACQDCWVSLEDGRRVRACETLVEDGMSVLTYIKIDSPVE